MDDYVYLEKDVRAHQEEAAASKEIDRMYKTIRIYHECEGRIEKSGPRITVCHHEACGVMTNGDPEGRIFLSYSHPNNGFFFLLTIRYHILFLRKGSKKEMRHVVMTSL